VLRWLAPYLVLGAFVCACGDDATTLPDAGDAAPDAADGDAGLVVPSGATITPPATPAEAAFPTLTPCPDGWREIVSADDPTACEPWPEGGAADCGPGEAHFPGTPGCAAVGPACPADGVPDITGLSAVLHVAADASPGGDGSAGAPFSTIGDASAVATSGATIAVAAGTYDEAVSLDAGVTLRGACARDTIITHSLRDLPRATIDIVGSGAALERVTVQGSRSGVRVDQDATGVRVDAVIVDRATETGLRVHRGAEAAITDLVVRDTITELTDGISAFGLVVELDARATVRRAVIERNRAAGVIVDSEGSHLVFEDAAVRQTSPNQRDDTLGVGFVAQRGATAEIRRSVIEDSYESGITLGDDTEIELDQVVVRRTESQRTTFVGGWGIQLDARATLRASRILVEDNRVRGIFVTMAASAASLSDVWVRRTQKPLGSPHNHGMGLQAIDSTTTTGARILLDDNEGVGMTILDGAEVTLEDVVVRRTEASDDPVSGHGIVVQAGARAELARVRLTGNRLAALHSSDEGSFVHVSDLVVSDTRPAANGDVFGRGVHAQGGAEIIAERVVISGGYDSGFTSLTGSTMTVRDARISDVEPAIAGVMPGVALGVQVATDSTMSLERVVIEGISGWGAVATATGTLDATDVVIRRGVSIPGAPVGRTRLGRGLEIQRGATGTLTRALIEQTRDVGLAVSGAGSTLDATDVVVATTGSNEADDGAGNGLYVSDGATVALSSALFEGNRTVTVLALGDGSIADLDDIQILDSREAVCGDACRGGSAGIGVGAYDGAVISATEFTIRGAALCGVQVGLGGAVDLSRGEVSSAIIGANVQDPSFDLSRLQDDVRYVDNDQNLASEALPVPEPPATVASEGATQ